MTRNARVHEAMTPGYIIFWTDDSLSPKVKSVGADHVIQEFMTNCELGLFRTCELFKTLGVIIDTTSKKPTN